MFALELTGKRKEDEQIVLRYMEDILIREESPLRRVANLANVSSLLYYFMPSLNWVGFYVKEGETLVLGPFQGEPACTLIPFSRGVCGYAARNQKTTVVPDVTAFPGHIACSSASRSELVVPVFRSGSLWGLLDIDSPQLSRFSEEDVAFVEKVATLVEKSFV